MKRGKPPKYDVEAVITRARDRWVVVASFDRLEDAEAYVRVLATRDIGGKIAPPDEAGE